MFSTRTARNALLGAALCLLCVPSVRADLAELRKAGKIRVLAPEGAPDLFSWKAGRPPGLEGEILQSFCRLEHLDLEIHPVPSLTAAIHGLEKNEGDVAAGGLLATDGDGILYSAEVLPSRAVVLTLKRPDPLKVEDLKGIKFGTTRALAEALISVGVPAEQVDDSIAPGTLISALKSGRLEACLLGAESAIPARAADPELQLGPFVGAKSSIAYGLRGNEPQLRDALNVYLGNLRRSATWNRLVLRYFGDSAAEILKASR